MSLSSESNMLKELENSHLIYYNVNLMTDASKIIVKDCRKIIAKYRQQISPFIAYWESNFTVFLLL